jgi:hypothetical protein
MNAPEVKTLTIGGGSPGTGATIVDRVVKPASTEELAILYRKAVFDRVVVRSFVKGVVAAVRVRNSSSHCVSLGSEILLQKLNLRFVAGTTDR